MYAINSMIGVIFLTLFLLTTQEALSQDAVPPKFGNIGPGVGYSEDAQQVVAQVCYKTTATSTSGQQNRIQLSESVSFSELERELGVSVSVSGKYGMFSAEAQASYMRSVRNTDLSMSFNYFEYATNNVAVQIAGFGEEALTDFGKAAYNSGKNPYFGLLCGDHYIHSYKQGALLTMSINLKFKSSTAKTTFESKIGPSWGDIISATVGVKSIVTRHNIDGLISIQAFQMGGEPSQLSKILGKTEDGQYYAVGCNLQAMDNCIRTVNSLLHYAESNFAEQFSFENNTGLTPFGIAFADYNSIDLIGLIRPTSFVTPEVEKYRHELACRFEEYQYYQGKLYPFANNGYPVKLDAVFEENVTSMLSKTSRNLGILTDSHGGAIDCFNTPHNCRTIKARIDSQLDQITPDSLIFLTDLKYRVTTRGGMMYNTGGGLSTSWLGIPNPFSPRSEERLLNVKKVNISKRSYTYETKILTGPISRKLMTFSCIDCVPVDTTSMFYNGTLCSTRLFIGIPMRKKCKEFTEEKQISPFFFELYDTMKQCH